MGNKNGVPPKGPNPTGTNQREEEGHMDGDAGPTRDQGPGPGPELLASLQSLRENPDYTLLPLSLHQMAEACARREDYWWAIHFLQLEKLYHQRLLSNLAALQDDWESQWRERRSDDIILPAETDAVGQKHMETLSRICRTHHRPSVSVDQNTQNATLKDLQSEEEPLQPRQNGVNEEEEELEEQEQETPEEEVKVEWPTGVPQASDQDLALLVHAEGSSSPEGLVSILKRRRASLDGLPPPSAPATNHNSRRKVHFSEPEDGSETDEVGGDSCLILLLLCLVTVVISVGGTALYCTLVDTYSNICTDFTHNVDFYVGNVRRFVEGLGRWLPLRT